MSGPFGPRPERPLGWKGYRGDLLFLGPVLMAVKIAIDEAAYENDKRRPR